MDKPSEILLFEFLKETCSELEPDDLLYDLELHDTIHRSIKTDRGLRVGIPSGAFSPVADGEEKEFDVEIELVVFVRVAGSDKTDRQPALCEVFQIQSAVYALLRENPSLGGRVCDTVLLRGARNYDVYDGEAYAVASVPLIINPSGARYSRAGYENY